MEVKVNFATESRARALAKLRKAKNDDAVMVIHVVAPHDMPLPIDMKPFYVASEGAVGKNNVFTFTRG